MKKWLADPARRKWFRKVVAIAVGLLVLGIIARNGFGPGDNALLRNIVFWPATGLTLGAFLWFKWKPPKNFKPGMAVIFVVFWATTFMENLRGHEAKDAFILTIVDVAIVCAIVYFLTSKGRQKPKSTKSDFVL